MYIRAVEYDSNIRTDCLQNLSLRKQFSNTCCFRDLQGHIVTFSRFPGQLVPGGIICQESEFGIIRKNRYLSVKYIEGRASPLRVPSVSSIPASSVSKVMERWQGMETEFRVEIDRFVQGRDYGRLVGLGPGLTPAGDDFLVGFMAARSFAGRAHCLDPDYSRTTEIGGHFLKSAVKGIFSQNIIEFIRDGNLSLLSFGASSGTAAAMGILAGMN